MGARLEKILSDGRQTIYFSHLANTGFRMFQLFSCLQKKKRYVFEDDFNIPNKLLIVNFCGVFSAFAVDKLSENVQQTKLYRK